MDQNKINHYGDELYTALKTLTPVAPLTDRDRRPVTLWPRVPVLAPTDTALPWTEAGRLLARLHSSPVPAGLPRHGWLERLARVRDRAPADLTPLAHRLHAEVAGRPEPSHLVHGDWHLGQLGEWTDGWRLIDIDDVDGLFVGRAAWTPEGFARIIEVVTAAAHAKRSRQRA